MKESKHDSRPGNRSPVRSVSIRIRDCQVTVKVRTAVPQVPSSASIRPHFR